MSICFDSPRRQRGDMMLEALIGVLITSVIGAGLAQVAGRVMNSQRDAKIENLAVERLRDQLQSRGVALCGSSVQIELPTGSKDVAVACEAASPNLTVSGITRAVDAPQQVELKVAATDLGIRGATGSDAPLTLSSRQ